MSDERTRLVSGGHVYSRLTSSGAHEDPRTLSHSLKMSQLSSSFQEKSGRSRLSKGKITEKRESVKGDSERQKVTYVFQASNASSTDSLQRSDEEVDGHQGIQVSHCHTDAIQNSMDKKARKKLIIASVLCLFFMIGEMVGGFLAHSLAIISDAAHLLTDFASFMISLLALYLANRPATSKFSFGWHRAEILGAFASILMLWVLTGILVFEAIERTRSQDFEINAMIMLITSATGVAFNIVLGTTLHQHSHSHGGGSSHGHSHGGHSHGGHSHGGHSHRGHSHGGHSHGDHSHDAKAKTPKHGEYGTMVEENDGDETNSHAVIIEDNGNHHRQEGQGHGHSHGQGHGHDNKGSNINVKAAFVHVVGDLLQSIGVLAAAFIIYFKPEWKLADPICTFLFSIFVLVTTVTIMKDIVMVLMEAAPKGLSFTEVRETLLSLESVVDVHNLRLWSLTMDKVAVSAHLAIEKDCNPHEVLKDAYALVRKNFRIAEMTFQIEEYITEMKNCNDCKGPKH